VWQVKGQAAAELAESGMLMTMSSETCRSGRFADAATLLYLYICQHEPGAQRGMWGSSFGAEQGKKHAT
jgi:hypothetical protein